MFDQSGLHGLRALAAGFVLLACAAPRAEAGVALGLTPMRVEIKADRGGSVSGALSLINETAERTRVRTELLDFTFDDSATPQFLPSISAEEAQSCRRWITVNPMETELEAEGRLTVRYTVRVPANAEARAYHCAIGFTTMPALDRIAGMGIRSAVRIVAAVYVVVGEHAAEGALGGVKLERAGTPQAPRWTATLLFRNSGLIHYRPTGEVAVLNAFGAVLETANLESIPVLPQRNQRLLVPLKSSFDGERRHLRVRIDIGTAEILEATVDVTPPPGQGAN